MSPARRMGTWRNPPLAYVVAEVQFAAYFQLGHHVADFQAAIRDRFPRTQEANVLRLEVQGNAPVAQPEKVWRFFSEDQRLGIDLSVRHVGFHATEYSDFPEFSETLGLVLRSLDRTIPGLFVNRLGLRYIDYILPRANESTWDYLIESLRGVMPPRSKKANEAYWIAGYECERGSINLRVMPVLPKGLVFPPNFGPIEVAPAETQLEAMKRGSNGDQVGCIDTDRLIPVERKLNPDEVLELFSGMHTDVFDTFKATMSKKAEEAWV